MDSNAFKKHFTKIMACLIFWAPLGIAEVTSDPTNPGSYGGLVGGVLSRAQKAQGDSGAIAEDTTSSDRKKNAKQGGDKANSGAAAAATAGGIMIGAGTRMMASPILPVALAGVNLFTKGLIEMAQSAASAGAGQKNHAQKDLLKRTEGDTGSQSTGAVAATTALPPEAESLLRSKNIDPSDYMQKAVSGELDTAEMATLFGLEGVTPDTVIEADGIASGELNDIFSTQLAETIKFDEGQKNGAATDEKAAIFNPSSNGVGVPAPTSATVSSDSFSGAGSRQLASLPSVEKLLSVVPPTVPLDGTTWNGVLHSLNIPAEVPPWEKKVTVESKLDGVGIELPRRGVNIFEKAKLRYQKYSDWRKGKSVASH